MVDLNSIIVLEVQPTQQACSSLLLQELAFRSLEQWMPAQALAPIRYVAIIRAGRSFHFVVVLDVGAIM
ncbi:MAG: hypothetical protein NVSMB27_15330 [Ktedonobacteraceae bacterium]